MAATKNTSTSGFSAEERAAMRAAAAERKASQKQQDLDKALADTIAQLPDNEKDKLLSGLEKDEVRLEGANGRAFFEQLLQNTQEGFFADPVYGGNRNMAGWKMIGYPGARYDYRDWVERHNERYPLPPVSIGGRAG